MSVNVGDHSPGSNKTRLSGKSILTELLSSGGVEAERKMLEPRDAADTEAMSYISNITCRPFNHLVSAAFLGKYGVGDPHRQTPESGMNPQW